LYFLTTLYVDVKEPAFCTFRGIKKLNPAPAYKGPSLAKATAGKRDKIESICSPKMYKNNPDYIGARGQRDEQNNVTPRRVNQRNEVFFTFLGLVIKLSEL
jgi:hypothetical protein